MYSLQELNMYINLKDNYFSESNEWHIVINDKNEVELLSKGFSEYIQKFALDKKIEIQTWSDILALKDRKVFKLATEKILSKTLSEINIMVKTASISFPSPLQIFMKYVDLGGQGYVLCNVISTDRLRDKILLPSTTKDILTGVFNRTYFNYILASRAEIAQSTDVMALAYFDIVEFHKINENLGIAIGDLVLKKFFRVINQLTPEGAMIARNGVDQALLLFEGPSAGEDVKKIVDELHDYFKREILIKGHKIKLKFSVGITIYPELLPDVTDLMISAETALNMSKESKQGNYTLYDKLYHESVKASDTIYNELRLAIDNNEFSLHYQPLYDSLNHLSYGAEVLLRWNSHILGSIPPSVFIPLAEQSDLIIDIGKWVIIQTLKQMKEWRDLLPKHFIFSINVSPIQISHDDFEEDLITLIKDYGVVYNQIQIELTESVFVEDYVLTCRKLEYLKSFGIKIAMDDFGTGYSSLNYLRNLPLDVLKIDKLFTDQICKSHKEKAIAKTIVELANLLDLSVIAEGVETQDQLLELEDIGCNKIQGYLIGKPVDKNSFRKNFLESQKKVQIVM